MTAFTIDIHEFYNELKDAGFTEKQADVIAKIQGKAAVATVEQAKHDYKLDDVASKRDIKELELKIELVRADLMREIEKSKSDLMRLGFLQIGLIVALLLKVIGMI
jgi:hypothetical protein